MYPKLPKVACPVCGTKFQKTRKDQIYDTNKCNQKAYHTRLRAKLERLERIEKGAA
jgi:DNA repair exonuclease SbcCD ATPase subunit